jgi:uncharacterized membrane protein
MTTPAIILVLLLLPLGAAHLTQRRSAPIDLQSGGIAGLVLAFVFFGIGHFARPQEMTEMLPPMIPGRVAIIYATGILEWGLAAGLAFPRTRRAAGWACIAVLVGFFPANIYAAANSIGMGGHQWGPIYLLIRAPLQLLLIVWTYWFAIKEWVRCND